MELIIEPDTYSPSIDDLGNYIDKLPSFNNLKHGIRCPCGSRKDKAYESHSVFSQHIKTKTHQKWLSTLNLNKANYYIESEKLSETVHNQRLIIAKLEKDNNTKSMTINYLTYQLTNQMTTNSKSVTVTDLLQFD